MITLGALQAKAEKAERRERAEQRKRLRETVETVLQSALDAGVDPGPTMVEGVGTVAALYPRIFLKALRDQMDLAILAGDWSDVDKFWGSRQEQLVRPPKSGNYDLDGDGFPDAYYDLDRDRWRPVKRK